MYLHNVMLHYSSIQITQFNSLWLSALLKKHNRKKVSLQTSNSKYFKYYIAYQKGCLKG